MDEEKLFLFHEKRYMHTLHICGMDSVSRIRMLFYNVYQTVGGPRRGCAPSSEGLVSP